MSVHRRAHNANSRTARFTLPILAVAAAALVAGCGKQNSVDPELTASLIQPVAKVELKVEKVAAGSRTGEQIYKNVCGSCHDSGALGSPKTGDAAAWGPRLALGFDALVKSAIAGKNSMPARGGASDLTDTEVKRAVAFLANKAGANFAEPPVEN